MKKYIYLSFLFAGSLLLAGCGPTTPAPAAPGAMTPITQPSANPANTGANTANPAPAQTSSVNIQNFAFSPSALTITKGATVTWTNNDSAPHQIASATFNSQALSQGQTYSFTFTQPGTYSYSCSIHPSMTGTITVQ